MQPAGTLAFRGHNAYDCAMDETTFQALVVRETESGFIRQIENRTIADLPAGDVLIRVRYSSLNYKDALSANGNRGVTRRYPHTPGIDAVGQVVESAGSSLPPGAWVISCGYDLGMNTPGGFGQYIRVPASWLLPLPPAIDPLSLMVLGTAGFTAALSLYKLENAGLRPGAGPGSGEVLVTGATGGVGSIAVALLAKVGYHVVAATGKLDQTPLLQQLGAAEVIHRSTLEEGAERALLKQRWSAVLDTVGGQVLAGAIKATVANGWVTTCGNVASAELPITVYPFILRGVSLLGIDSANVSLETRRTLLAKLLGPWRVELPTQLITITGLAGLSQQIERTLQGQQVGRVVVDLWPDNLSPQTARS
jgi:putative YhdH/YhfP family quinone oxidoreductase